MRSLRPTLASSLAALLVAGLAPAAWSQTGTAGSFQKISSTSGGLGAVLGAGDEFSYSMGSIGDLNGDGVPDIAVGAPWDDTGGTDRGAVYVLFLNANGTVKAKQKIASGTGGFTGTLQDTDWFGWCVNGIGDVNHDGINDLAVGAISTDDAGTETGALWILFMNTNGTVKATHKISNLGGGLTGVLPDFEWFGTSVAPLGDIDGDGVVDIAVGAHGDSDNGTFRGAVYVLNLKTDGTVKTTHKINETNGGFVGPLHDGDEFGWGLAPVGDLDGNGVADLAVAAELDDDGGLDHGAVWILFLQGGPNIVKGQQKISQLSGNFPVTLHQQDLFGHSVASLGDLDGDGIKDLAVGAYQDDDGGKDKGAVYNLFLNADGTVKNFVKISSTQGGFGGALALSDKFGSSVASPGDVNGDGVADLAVGAALDNDGAQDAGAVWVLDLDAGPWTNLGSALAGAAGNPGLVGNGTLVPASAGSITLSHAAQFALSVMFVGLVNNPVPFKGGLLVPVPSLLEVTIFTDGDGKIPLPFSWPTGVPSGTSFYFQYGIQDGLAVKGVALSNALQGTTP